MRFIAYNQKFVNKNETIYSIKGNKDFCKIKPNKDLVIDTLQEKKLRILIKNNNNRLYYQNQLF